MADTPAAGGAGPSESFVLPASSAQQRLWLLEQLEPGNSAYNLSRAHRLAGPLDVSSLQASLNALVQRHESLRTTFATIDEETVEIVAASLTLPLRLVDLHELPQADRPVPAHVEEPAVGLRSRPRDQERLHRVVHVGEVSKLAPVAEQLDLLPVQHLAYEPWDEPLAVMLHQLPWPVGVGEA